MASARRSDDDQPPIAVRALDRVLAVDRGWWATLIGLAVVLLAWAVP